MSPQSNRQFSYGSCLYLCSLILMSTGAQGHDIMQRLDDGVLVLGGHPLRALTAEWTLIVAIDAPLPHPNILLEIQKIRTAIDNRPLLKHVANSTVNAWIHHLKELEIQVLSLGKPGPRRHKRSILGFLAPAFQTIFGLATEQELETCQNAVEVNRKSEQRITHTINEMITVVNHTRKYIKEDRARINELWNYTRTLGTIVNNVMDQTNTFQRKLSSVVLARQIENIIDNLQNVADHFQTEVEHFQDQRASLELGRLTEELLPVRELHDLLQRATTNHIQPIDPMEWYYQSVYIRPIWSSEMTLLYKATIPLVDGITYLRYNVHTWRTPINESGYSIKLLMSPDVAIDTTRGTILEPHSCLGKQPEVCRTGPLYGRQRGQCPRGILLQEDPLKEHCNMQIAYEKSMTEITEVQHGQYSIVTWGDKSEIQCQGELGQQSTLPYGVYIVSVPENCTITGKGWTLTGILRRHSQRTLMSGRVDSIAPLDLTFPEDHVLQHLDVLRSSNLSPVKDLTLSELRTPPDVQFTHSQTSWETIVLISIIIVLLSSGLAWYVWKVVLNPYHRRPNRLTGPVYDPNELGLEEEFTTFECTRETDIV